MEQTLRLGMTSFATQFQCGRLTPLDDLAVSVDFLSVPEDDAA